MAEQGRAAVIRVAAVRLAAGEVVNVSVATGVSIGGKQTGESCAICGCPATARYSIQGRDNERR